MDETLLEYLVNELSNRSGFDFETFVRSLLTKKHGPSKWPPRDGSDGKIDFCNEDILFQIYGSQSRRGSLHSVKTKIQEVKNMMQTAQEYGLGASRIVLLTNIRPNTEMAGLILKAGTQGIEIKDVHHTAEYLYDVYYPFERLQLYHDNKSSNFMDEDVCPYEFDEEKFVDKFDIKYGRVLSRDTPLSDEDCLSFVSRCAANTPIFCVGYYGMGKTTISKILFKKLRNLNPQVFPIYIALTHQRLSDFSGTQLSEYVAEQVQLYSSKNSNHDKGDHSTEIYDADILAKNIHRMITNRMIFLIFDGIDEAIYERKDLFDFLYFIVKNNLPSFTTCRLEFRPFFDVYQSLKLDEKQHICIELCEWKEPQWHKYIDVLSAIYPTKKYLIATFEHRLFTKIYSTLPYRPLFLKMLSDLEINNKTTVSITEELPSNLSEIYFKFIQWKIEDDYKSRGVVYDFDSQTFERECFQLLKEIAFREYKSTSEMSPGVTLETIRSLCVSCNFSELTDHYISNVLLKSSLFAILRRTDNDRFIFSHKSFMEYLVAFRFIDCLFRSGKPDDACCDDTWNCFQTYEISQHFIDEIERVRVTLKLTVEQAHEFILSAFIKVACEMMKGDVSKFDEKLQTVLYYTGKLGLKSEELSDALLYIHTNSNKVDPAYFRTASLALSMIIGPEYCEKYVLYLLKDCRGEGKHFKLNQDIQIRYYGEASLRLILKKDIDNYILAKDNRDILALELLTFFIGLPINRQDIQIFTQYLDQVIKVSIEQKHNNLQLICKEISLAMISLNLN